MSQLKFDRALSFSMQTVLNLATTFAALRFSLINRSTAPACAVVPVLFSIAQAALQKNYRLEKGYYLASFAGMASVGALLKTSWKANLLMSTLFTAFQFIFSHFPKNALSSAKPTTEPITSRLTSSTDHAIRPTHQYIQLDITANSEQSKNVLSPVEFIFCIDVSDSMNGPRIEKVKEVLGSFLSKIGKELEMNKERLLYISLITFNHKAETIQNKVQITKTNLLQLQSVVNAIKAAGDTSIMAALEEATRILGDSDRPNKIAAFFVSPLTQRVNTCVKSLIFLTDGDSAMKEPRVRELQEIWKEKSVNLFAVGISKGHRADIMQMIVCDQTKRPLTNASYQWVPEANEPSTEGTSLEDATSAIFSQTLNQNIQSISVRPTSSPALQMLNTKQEKDGSFILGALSEGQSIQRFFYCNSPASTTISLEFSVQTQQGNHTVQISDELKGTYSADIHRTGIKQRIVEMLRKLDSINDKDQRTALSRPVLTEAEALSNPDEELKSLIGDLKKAIEERVCADQDASVRRQRIARGRELTANT